MVTRRIVRNASEGLKLVAARMTTKRKACHTHPYKDDCMRSHLQCDRFFVGVNHVNDREMHGLGRHETAIQSNEQLSATIAHKGKVWDAENPTNDYGLMKVNNADSLKLLQCEHAPRKPPSVYLAKRLAKHGCTWAATRTSCLAHSH